MPRGLHQFKTPSVLENRHIKVARLSTIRSSLSEAESTQGPCVAGRIKSI
jgi:hypothetical protein